MPFPGETYAISSAYPNTAWTPAPPHLSAELGPPPLSLAYENTVKASIQEPFRVLVLCFFFKQEFSILFKQNLSAENTNIPII